MVWLLLASGACTQVAHAQEMIDVAGFQDGSHHWYDIEDEEKVIQPLPNQPRYKDVDIKQIADNILLYQKSNGGWPKNYDMLAILTPEQKRSIDSVRNDINTTFDNGSTHAQVLYLAKAYLGMKDRRYSTAALKGIDFILAAQYPNGGWPQFYPDTSGYRKHITFNDGAMTGIVILLQDIVQHKSYFSFVDTARYARVQRAYQKGVDCILSCQIVKDGKRTAWCQQHDNADLRPQSARNFEPASVSGRESAEIVRLLMSINNPTSQVVTSVNGAIRWLVQSGISGIRVEDFKAPVAHNKYRRNVDFDRKVVHDPNAPVIWARMYELETNVPLFCNRDKKPVYSLAEVERERRTGYSWYSYEPAEVLKTYPVWQQRWSPDENALGK
jgi:PelA/Pel-15E family pectate lyase